MTGQGGNNALETSAALANHLVASLKANASGNLSTAEIMSVFEKTQKQREDRTWGLVKQSHNRQRLECMETPFLNFIAKCVLPYIPKSVLVDRWVDTYSAAASLRMIPTPERGNTIPYFDQLIRQPAARAKISYLLYVVFAVLAVVASWLLSGALRTNGTLALVREAIVNGQIDSLNGDLRRYYTGISSIDKILVILVTIFLPAISSNRQEQPLQLLYFLASMLPLIAIFTIEGYRQKNKWSLIAR